MKISDIERKRLVSTLSLCLTDYVVDKIFSGDKKRVRDILKLLDKDTQAEIICILLDIIKRMEVDVATAQSVEIQLLNKSIDALGLTTRTRNCLINKDILYIGSLIQKKEVELRPGKIPNLGRKSFHEIKRVLADRGLSLETKDVGDWKAPR